MKKVLAILFVTLLMVIGIVPAGAQADQTIVEIAAGNDDFETLVTAVTEAGLAETLSGDGPFTVFAPTDDAFAKLPAGALESLLADKEALTAVLTYHVVAGEVLAADVVTLNGQEVATVNGETVKITVDGNTVMVNDATVVATDIQGSNGVIHVIDTVLMPPSMAAAETPATTTAPITEAPAVMPTTGASETIALWVAAIGVLLISAGYLLRSRLTA